uniref:C2H2-type domain-containing protein n=2 Tax=Hordeum vulgare subsp. vulgare TaxID=112509 RepID=A0A8I6WVT8_HORVV
MQEGSPLDLNNLPEEYGKQAVESSTTTAASSGATATATATDATRIKKKSTGRKDEAGKVYECRFCSLKFGKSQALGGHMNRHRQERETETLNRARQLVFGNDTLSSVDVHAQMSFRDAGMGGSAPSVMLGGGGFRGGVNGSGGGVVGDPSHHPFRPVHPRVSPQTPPSYHYLYSTTPSALHPMSYPATYAAPPRQQPPSVGDYVIGHAISPGDAMMQQQQQRRAAGFTSCFGAPVAARQTAPGNVQPDHNYNFGCGGHTRNVNASS